MTQRKTPYKIGQSTQSPRRRQSTIAPRLKVYRAADGSTLTVVSDLGEPRIVLTDAFGSSRIVASNSLFAELAATQRLRLPLDDISPDCA